MLDKPHVEDALAVSRNARGRMRLPAKVLLSLTEAVRARLQAEADHTHSTVSAIARERILRTLAEDDQRANVA
jgi:hypothetical protein